MVYCPDLLREFPAISVATALAALSPARGQVIDDHFDAAEISDWIPQGNGFAIQSHELTQAGSLLTSEVVPSQSWTNYGFVSESSFEPSATGGFSLTATVDGVVGQPAANGFFVGLVRDGTQFFRAAGNKNFGIAMFGIDERTGSGGGFGLIYGDNNDTLSADFQFANSDAQGDVEFTSFADGFVVTIHVDPSGWSYEIQGLLDALGAETTFADGGTWADAGTDFETFFPAGDTWHVIGTLQTATLDTYSIAFDRITLDAGDGTGGPGFQIISTAFDHDEVDPTATITWRSRPATTYAIDFSTDLQFWLEVTDSVESTGEETAHVHRFLPFFPELVGAPKVFYKVREAD